MDAAEYNKYKSMGYSDADIAQALKDVNAQQYNPLMSSYNQALSMSQAIPNMSNTMMTGNQNQDNLIKWQLELDSILERIEHMLKGDRPTMINGNMVFIEAKDDEDRIFNDFGVSEIMRILSMYLNRNTILSNYDEETINWKVLDFGYEVSDLIFMKYEAMGMDSLEKRKRYPMIVRELVDSVHSSFLRALNGGERDSLRQARTINQSETIMGGQGQMFNGQLGIRESRSLLKPSTWFAKSYG